MLNNRRSENAKKIFFFHQIPILDWELTNSPFVSLLYVHNRCDAVDCLCPEGRKYIIGQGEWKYSRCRFCGSVGTHAGCRTDGRKGTFGCESCLELEEIDTQNANDSKTKPNISGVSGQRKRKHSFDEEGEGKVWKMVPTKLCKFRKSVIHLTDPNEEPTADPQATDERQKMSYNRMQMFFDKAQFDAKPPTPPWII